ncbi:MAG: hypothetical protein QOH64_3187 [Acidimicrobiaceae bacterium]
MKRARAAVMLAVLGVPLVFSVAAAPSAAAAVAVTVDPTTGLADGQAVTATGSGFGPNVTVGAAECSAAVGTSRSTSDCDLSTSRTTNTDASGAATIVLRAKRTITTASGTVDCVTATSPCIIGMADINDIASGSGMAITFDPNAPPAPPPTVDVNPDTGLVDLQQVAVTATGFIPGEGVQVVQCAASAINDCFPGPGGGYSQADPTGAVAVGITVRRAVYVHGTRLDCASAPGACVITAQASGGPVGKAALGFDDSVPLPPPPTITATPHQGLADRQVIAVAGSGFTPHNQVVITQCEAGFSLNQGHCSFTIYRQAEVHADGSFASTTQVRRMLEAFDPATGQPLPIDCAITACVVSVIDGFDYTATAETPISFDPSAPPFPPPTATVTPSTGLVDDQVVAVTADGFAPGANVVIVQCKVGAIDASGCDVSALQSGNVDDNGHLQGDYHVKRILTFYAVSPVPPAPAEPVSGITPPAAAAFSTAAPDAPVETTFDCASAPDACSLAVAFIGSTIEAASVTLSFAPIAAPPPEPGGGGGGPTAEPGGGTPTGSPGSTPTTTGDVVEDTSVTRSPAEATGPLARTGSDFVPLLQRDLALLLLGSLALVASHRLRHRHRGRHFARR